MRWQYVEMGYGGAPRGTAVQHGFHYLGSEDPYFEPERYGELVGQWHWPYRLRRRLAVARNS